MRIYVCDYSGHPFQVQLCRELARRGNTVVHTHFADFQTPRGRLHTEPGDPPNLEISPVSLGKPFKKYGFVERRFQEIRIGKAIADRITAFHPDVVIGCNLPIDALDKVVGVCSRKQYPFIFWQHDTYSRAITDFLANSSTFPARLV